MSKKMCPKRNLASKICVMGYSCPVYHEGDKCFVDFYAYDPAREAIRRKKYHLDSVGSKRARRDYAKRLISELSIKLSQGWRPWADEKTASRGYVLLDECFKKYLERISRSSRKKTIHSYTSRVNILKEYLSTLSVKPKYACEITREFIIGYLDWLLSVRKVEARTYNNYRDWMAAFCDYLKDRGYLKENPASDIPKMKKCPKKRKPLTADMLRRLMKYLETDDRHYLLAVMMEYYTFIRPNELSYVRIQDISVKEQRVFVPGIVSKNGHDGNVALNETILRLMIDLGVLSEPGNWYLFGKDFRPGPRRYGADTFNKRWAKVRKVLGFGDEIQFYSLKDAGIRDLANSAGIVTAKRQARHSDISTTNKYLEGVDCPLPEEAKHFKGQLS